MPLLLNHPNLDELVTMNPDDMQLTCLFPGMHVINILFLDVFYQQSPREWHACCNSLR